MTLKEFIEDRFKLTLNKLGVEKFDIHKFVLFTELNTEKKSLSSREDMVNWWVLPNWVNRELKFEEVIDSIHFFDSITPMWIKVSWILKDNLIGLELCQRLRKRKEVLQHHQNSELAPFIIVDSYLKFDDQDKRNGLLKYLTLRLRSSLELKEYFDKHPPSLNEIKECIKNNFKEHFVFFPNDYSHRSKGEDGYTENILKLDSKSGNLEILNRNFEVLSSSKNIDAIIEQFISTELKNRIGEIEIIK